jgi:hypothetical protein
MSPECPLDVNSKRGLLYRKSIHFSQTNSHVFLKEVTVRVFRIALPHVYVFGLFLGSAAVSGGCGGGEGPVVMKPDAPPSEVSKNSMDAYKAQMAKNKTARK